ncbi:MAG: LamG domain-containing protein, partial [Pyrinomonadaceae bacterium]
MYAKTMKFLTAVCFLVLAFVTVSEAQVCTPAPVGLISWWAADGNALDSRSRNNGALQNGATFTAGQNGQAFSFDGIDDHIVVPHNANQNMGDKITIEGWVNP